ncbi:amidohydrolase family protein [Streptomyces sp. 4N509B]|uniref:amidohydrolase family protein n=1 Tax=Streptomyces sp. 4N509B TaxID=3457413 RepID=UPI003FD00A2B
MNTDLSRRALLQATAATAAVTAATAAAVPAASAAPASTPLSPLLSRPLSPPSPPSTVSLTLTAATNGAATLSPADGALVAEVQNVLWSIPRDGGRATPLTPPELEPTRPTFSPDGRTLAVCAYHGGGYHIWTLRPDGSELRQLTDGPFDDRAPAWSPDGTRIAFASERGGDTVAGSPYRVWVLDLGTGDLTPVTGLPGQDGPLQEGHWEDFDPTWSPDGRRLTFVRAALTTTGTPTLQARTIASVAADGTGPVVAELTDTGPAGAQVMTPSLSPAGRLAYLRTTPAPTATCTLVVDGTPVPLDGDVMPAPPRWVSPDELLVSVDGHFRLLRPEAPAEASQIGFSATLPVARPRYRIKRYDLDDGGGRRTVRTPHLPALSPDGRQVAFVALNALWTAPVSGRGAPRRLLRSAPTRYLLSPSWTPDGRGLVYAHDPAPDGLLAIHRLDLATGETTTLASGGRVFPALSPDGTRLACLDMSGNLLLTDLASGEERVLAPPVGGNGLPGAPSWSPDGRHIALADRNRLNQRFREGYNLIRVVDASTGADALHPIAPHTSLSDRYAAGPAWSPDGAWLAVVAESALWLVPVDADGTPTGAARQLTDEAADHPSWSGDAGTLLYLSAGTLRTLRVRDGEGGTPRTVPLSLGYRRPRAMDTVVHAGRLWDGTGEAVLDDVDLVVRDGRVAAVEPHRPGRRAARRVDASDHTVIPGLWDAHTHPYQSYYGGRQTTLQLAYGITTAVSLGGFAHEQARIRDDVASGELAGPRLLATGELLDGPRVAYSMGRAHATREGVRRSLDRAEGLDWDFVKTYVRAPGWLMAEAAERAHRLGVRSGSHLCTPGVQLGQDLTTHLQATQRGEFGRATTAAGHAYADLVEIYSAAGAGFHLVATPFTALPLIGADPALADDPRVTTLMAPWDVPTVVDRAARPPSADELATLDRETGIYRRVLDAGGLVALGTDQPLVPIGLHLHLALRALHRAGLTPAEALRTATLLPARVFGADGDLGTLVEGKLADATIVAGDPFDDFDTLVNTTAVLRGGVPFHQAELLDAYAGAETFAGTDADAEAEREASRWREVGRLMRRGGCCDPGHGHPDH